MSGKVAGLTSRQALSFGIRLTWRSNPRLAVGVVSLQALEAVIPAVTLFLISRVVGRSSAHATFAELAPYLVVLALLAGLMTTLSELAGWRSDLLGDYANDSAQSRLADRAASASLADFDDSNWHDALARARAGAVHRPNEIAFSGVLLVKAIVGLAAMAGLLVSIDPVLLALAVLAAVPGYVIRKRLARARYDVMYESVHERREAEYLDRLLTDPKDALEVRAFQMEPALLTRSRSLRRVDLARKRAVTNRENRLQLPAAIAAAAIFAVAYLIIGHRAAHSLSPGSLVTLLGSFSAIIVGIDGAAQTLGTIESHRGFISDLHAFIGDLRPTVERSQSPQALSSPKTLRVENVYFGYAGRAPALSGVTADFASGTLTVLVGRNGAGKSTLLKVLNAQYVPDAGLVTIDGVDVASYPASAWRRAVAYLPQDAMRIELSLRDAVSLGDGSRPPTDADVAAALGAGQADVVQASLGHGLDAPLGQLLPGAHISVAASGSGLRPADSSSDGLPSGCSTSPRQISIPRRSCSSCATSGSSWAPPSASSSRIGWPPP